MPEPTAEELAEAGVLFTSSSSLEPIYNDGLARASFTAEAMPAEPPTDVKLTLQDGTCLRERLARTHSSLEGIVTDAAVVAPAGFTITISNALLNEDGSVETDGDGAVMIAPIHEVTFTGETLDRLGTEQAIRDALLEAREIAAAKAAAHFRGMALGLAVLAEPRA